MALIDDFKTRFPQFDSVKVDELWPFIDAQWKCYFGASYGIKDCDDEAILNLIAHLFTSELNSESSNASQKDIASQSVGSVSVTFGTGATEDSLNQWLNTTIYGQRFLILTMNSSLGAFTI